MDYVSQTMHAIENSPEELKEFKGTLHEFTKELLNFTSMPRGIEQKKKIQQLSDEWEQIKTTMETNRFSEETARHWNDVRTYVDRIVKDVSPVPQKAPNVQEWDSYEQEMASRSTLFDHIKKYRNEPGREASSS